MMFVSYINHPIGIIWWETLSAGFHEGLPMAFRDAVNEHLEEVPEFQTQVQFREILARVEALPAGTHAVPAQ